MEQSIKAREAMVTTLVEVSPTQLREVANLLELSVQRAMATDTILVKLTDRITFAFKPTQRLIDQLREKSLIAEGARCLNEAPVLINNVDNRVQ